MGEQAEKKFIKYICVGLLAHVDSGKTTLSESMLYLSGRIRKLGRVDNKDAFLDTHELERARGITIFSKQAIFTLGEREITILDTPGHVDFSAEMERTLQVMDYAILVISGAEGIQGHTETLWRLLARYQIPVFLFINKMDQNGTDKEQLLKEFQKRFGEQCVDFSEEQEKEVFWENVAVCDETLLETYLENGEIQTEQIQTLIRERKVFPCYFGSALKLTGVEAFLSGLDTYMKEKAYPDEFGAKVFKIARDEQGNRLTYMKITGGSLKVKSVLTNQRKPNGKSESTEQNENTNENRNENINENRNESGIENRDESRKQNTQSEFWEEKADQIRIYSGSKYESVNEVKAGTICAVTGLTKTYPGEGLGSETESELPILEPVLTYEIQLPPECNVHSMLAKLRLLEEEDPELHIVWREEVGEIHAQLMGAVQIEILKELIQERFGVTVEFGSGNIVYKETIAAPVVGVGHFEPLRHYAEVHILMEPAERGSGMQFRSDVSEDLLDRNWQRLVLTHLEEKEHKGVLTGSVITDMQITLVAGKAHLKHTEGGDFRQATYRAVRQGLKKAQSILLEPYYEFRLELPAELVGRALTDVKRMYGTFEPPMIEDEMAILVGSAPVSEMRDYQTEVISYTKGRGRFTCTLKGYEPCHNADEVIEKIGYDSESDLENPTGSVFCAHGAGFVVNWDDVEKFMHLDSGLSFEEDIQSNPINQLTQTTQTTQINQTVQSTSVNSVTQTEEKQWKKESPRRGTGQNSSSTYRSSSSDYWKTEKELEEIFTRTYGTSKREKTIPARTVPTRRTEETRVVWQKPEPVDEYLLVDGYNIIFAWEELKELAAVDIDGARGRLMDILCNYQGFKKCNLILVFDAYKVKGHNREIVPYHNIHVVYTKEAETADQYIEKTVHEIGHKYHVTVATSDGLEQMIIFGQGARRLSAREFKEEVDMVEKQIREEHLDKQKKTHNYLKDYMEQDNKKED